MVFCYFFDFSFKNVICYLQLLTPLTLEGSVMELIKGKLSMEKVARRTGGKDPVDIYVGSRIRLRRTMLSFSQEKLADQLGVTFQQVQKYENGSNRVGASRLYAVSRALSVPVSFFYEGYKDTAGRAYAVAEDGVDMDKYLNSRETVELIRSYYAVKDKDVRKKVLEMIKSLSPS